MYILLALVAAVAVGVGVHFALPHRSARGVALAPSLAAAGGAIAYGIGTWTLGEANGWTWIASLAAALVVGVLGTLAISRSRARRDAEAARRLGLAA